MPHRRIESLRLAPFDDLDGRPASACSAYLLASWICLITPLLGSKPYRRRYSDHICFAVEPLESLKIIHALMPAQRRGWDQVSMGDQRSRGSYRLLSHGRHLQDAVFCAS